VQLLYPTQDKRAIPLLKKILKVDPRDETAHEMLAILEGRQGNCQAANEHFLLSTSDRESSLLTGSIWLLSRADETTSEGDPIFGRLAALVPEQTYPKYDLAVLLVGAKQHEAALKVLEPLLATDQSDPDILSLASEAYEAVGNTPKAVSLLRQAIVLSPANANYYNRFCGALSGSRVLSSRD
jgi:Tfp pilus assembly protein PilF